VRASNFLSNGLHGSVANRYVARSEPFFLSAISVRSWCASTIIQVLGGLTCTCKLSFRASGPRNFMKISQR
jgi:hypothetical protein